MKKVITTVGTSIFTNYLDQKSDDIKDHYENLRNEPFSESEPNKQRVKRVEEKVLEWSRSNTEASAEIKSLIKIQKEVNEEIEVFLLTTDTILSNSAAKLIKEYFNGKNKNKIKITYKVTKDPTSDCIAGLQILDNNKFNEEGIFNLANRIYQIYRSRDYFNIKTDKNEPSKNNSDTSKEINRKRELNNMEDIFLNITGGFKGVIPFISIISQLMNIPIYYIFENSDELIRLPKIDIQFDWNIAEKNYYLLTELSIGHNVSDKEKESLTKSGLIKSNNSLTGIGKFYKFFIENEMPHSKNVFGFTVEHKIYHYLIQESYRTNDSYKFIENSNSDLNKKTVKDKPWVKDKGAEIDIVLKKRPDKINSPDNNYIACEIKSILQIENNNHFEKTMNQLESKLKLMERDNCYPDSYRMYVYTLNDFKFENFKIGEKKIKEMRKKIKEMRKKIKEYDESIVFEFFMVNYKLPKTKNKDENVYLSYSAMKLEDSNFKEIKI